MKQKFLYKPYFVIVLLVLGALACSLTADPPATLPPRTPISTLTPQSPIGPQASVSAPTNQMAPQLPTSVVLQVPSNPSITNQIGLVDANRLMNSVTTMVGFQNRHALGIANFDTGVHAAADYLLVQFTNIKNENPNNRIDAYEQGFTFNFGGQQVYGRNIIMAINGTDSGVGIIIVGAHYDTINAASPNSTTTYQPGADDNGSGVAAILELARIMAQQPHRGTILFVLFSAEEQGKYGASAFLNEYVLANGLPVVGMINLDMVGSPVGPNFARYDNAMRVYASPPTTDFGKPYQNSRQLARTIEFTTRYFVPGMTVNMQATIDRAGRWGDHEVFSEAGINAVRLIEQEDDPIRVHTARDEIGGVDGEYLRRTTQVTLATLLVLADGPSAPASIRIDPSTWRIDWLPSPGAKQYVVALRRAGALTFEPVFISEVTSFSWPDIRNYETVSIAAVDELGQTGPFSEEVVIPVGSLAQ